MTRIRIPQISCFILILLVSLATGKDVQDSKSLETCRQSGFDPLQLACDTCDLLPESVKPKCLQCCQSFRNANAKAKRYEAAVLIHPEGESFFPEIDELYKEDVSGIQKQKGKKRFFTKNVESASYFDPSPSMILWFKEIPSSSATVKELKSKAAEKIMLSGWKRDDARDMLMALLPDA